MEEGEKTIPGGEKSEEKFCAENEKNKFQRRIGLWRSTIFTSPLPTLSCGAA